MSVPETDRMAFRDLSVGTVFLAQTAVGFLGNLSLLLHYAFLYFIQHRLRSTDLIVKHLIVSNFLVILCKGVPQTMGSFGLQDFLSDLGCKLVFYFHRVGRGMTISSTCLLSVFQVIIISPWDSRWAECKRQAPRLTSIFIVLSWVLHMLVNTIVLKYMTDKRNRKNITYEKEFGYCSTLYTELSSKIFYAALLFFSDVVCVGLMLWASGSMVFILYRHKQQVQHLHSTNISLRPSPESRATKTVLLLVSTFVCFYMLSCIFNICLALSYNPPWVLVNTAAIVTGCFPTVSPFLLLSGDSTASEFCFSCLQNSKTSNPVGNM